MFYDVHVGHGGARRLATFCAQVCSSCRSNGDFGLTAMAEMSQTAVAEISQTAVAVSAGTDGLTGQDGKMGLAMAVGSKDGVRVLLGGQAGQKMLQILSRRQGLSKVRQGRRLKTHWIWLQPPSLPPKAQDHPQLRETPQLRQILKCTPQLRTLSVCSNVGFSISRISRASRTSQADISNTISR